MRRPPLPDPPSLPELPHDTFADDMADLRAEINRINTELGLRPYRVYSVRLHWSGGAPGHGQVTQQLEREYLPRPKVEFRTRREFQAMGWIERGTVTLTEINAQYAPQEVTDLFALTVPLTEADESFIEIKLDGRYGEGEERRRFVAAGPPERKTFEWRLELKQTAAQRSPEGAPSGQGVTRIF